MKRLALMIGFIATTGALWAQWGPDVRLTNNTANSLPTRFNDWALAVDGNNVHTVWYDDRDGNNEIYYKRSTNGGATWGADTRLTNNSGYSEWPAVAVSGSTIHVVWDDDRDGNNEIYYKRSTDGGVTWGADTRLTNNSGYSECSSVAVSGSTVHVVWSDTRDGNYEMYYKRSTDGGVTWGADTRLTNASGMSDWASVAVSGSTVHVVWTDSRDAGGYYEIYYKRSTDGGVTWGADTRLTNNPSESSIPSVAVSGSTVHVVWYDHYTGLYQSWYKRSTDGGVTWGADTQLTNYPGESVNPSVAVSGSTVHVVFCASDEIYYKSSTDGGITWGADTRLTNASGISESPSVAVSGSTVHVVWYDNRDGNNEIYYKNNQASNADVYVQTPLLTGSVPAAGMVWAGAAYTSYDTVVNNGPGTANTMTTTCWIDAVSNTQTIASLVSGAKAQNTFSAWTASTTVGTVHSRRDTTYAASPVDPNLVNNKVTASYTVVYDGQVVTIDAPPDTVSTATSYTPKATVKNNSALGSSDFSVVCTINPGGYSNTQNVSNLVAGSTIQLSFANWIPSDTAGITYTVTVTCQTAGDVYIANNTLSKTCYAKGDVGATEAVAPLDTVYVNTSYNPSARIKNFTAGTTCPFNIDCEIVDPSGGVIYSDVKNDSLGPSQVKLEVYKEWTVPADTGILYELDVFTRMIGDFDTTNDRVVWNVVSALAPNFDVGVASIDEPTGPVKLGQTITPQATVKNYGSQTVTFDVMCAIGPDTSWKTVTSLAKNTSQQLTFKNWTSSVPGNFTMLVKTLLASDINHKNDTMSVTFAVRGIEEQPLSLPTAFNLEAARPNPVSTWTSVNYALPVNTTVSLAVYDIIGKLVKTLIAGSEAAGYKAVRWDGRDNIGRGVANGLYFVRMKTPKYVATRKIILMR